jgi:hypothetical protein
MSERRTYTLEDDAVSCLEKVPKDLNSKFVSSLIVSFFKGESLLSSSEWSFLSGLVRGDDKYLPSREVSVPSDPVDKEKDRLRRVLLLLVQIDLSVYTEFCGFLSNPEVQVGGLFELPLSRIRLMSGFFKKKDSGFYGNEKVWVFHSDWEFLRVVPEPYWVSYSEKSLEYVLKKEAISLKPAFDLDVFLRSLLSVASSLVLEDLFYVKEHGMTKADWLEKERLEQEAEKERENKNRLEEEKRLQREKEERELLERKEFERRKLGYVASLEVEFRHRLENGFCSSSSVFRKCKSDLVGGYYLDSPGVYQDYPFGEPHFFGVFCKKHLSEIASVDWEKGEFQCGGKTYKIVSGVMS